MERIINAERVEQLIEVFGSFDTNIRKIEAAFGVSIVNRDTELKISGGEEAVDQGCRALEALMAACKRAAEGYESAEPPFVGINAYQTGAIEYVARVYVPTEAYWDVYYRFMLLIRQELKARNIVVLSDSTYIKNGDV